MSKKLKVSSKKAVKKGPAGKVIKKKPAPAPKKAVGKPAPKTAASKKPVKKAAKPVAKAKKVVKPAKKIQPAKPAKKSKSLPVKANAKVATKGKVVKSASPVKSAKSIKQAPAKVVAPKKVQSPSPAAKPKVEKQEKASPKKTVSSVTPSVNGKNQTSGKKEAAELKANEVLAINNTIPVAPKHEISLSKIASISQSITNPVRRNDSYAVKVEKEPNGKFELEFVFHASAEMLFEFVSTASGLSEWFCDDLNIRNGIYTFIWDDQLQQARLLKTIDLQLVRFQWVEKTDGSYFEFRIQRDDLTNDIALIVTDFAESNSEKESAKLLWNSQIEKLRHVLGSIF